MVANMEAPAALGNIEEEESHIHQYANKRWYTHIRSLHVRSPNAFCPSIMLMRRLTVYSNGYAPYASPEPPVEAVPDILCLDRADGILYTLWSTREIMPFPTGLQSL